MTGTPLPAVPGVRDIAGLVRWLAAYDDGKKWLKEAAAVVKENEKAAQLLGSREKIEAEIAAAERAKDKADALLESAAAQAVSIVDAAKAGIEERVVNLRRARAELDTQQAEFSKTEDRCRADLVERTTAVMAREAAIGEKEAAATEQVSASAAQEKRAEKLMAEAMKTKADAAKAMAGMRAALQDD